MIKAGISTATFFNKKKTEEDFDILRGLRCEYTEVFLTSFFEYEKKFIEKLLERKGDITVHSVHALGTQFEPQLFSENARVRADAELFFRKICIAAKMLDAQFYTFHGPLYFRNKKYDIDFAAFGRRLDELTKISRSYGVNLAYENIHYSYFCEPKFWTDICDLAPDLYATLDLKHAVYSGSDPYKFIEVMRDRIGVVHVVDMDKNKNITLPGEGAIDFEKLIKALLKVDYDGPLLLELYSTDYSDFNQLRDGLDYLNASLVKFRSNVSALRRKAEEEKQVERAEDEKLMKEAMAEFEKERAAEAKRAEDEAEE